MTIEDQLSRTLEQHLGDLEPGGADLGGARRAGAEIRRRRRLRVGALAACALVAVAGTALRPGAARRADPTAPGTTPVRTSGSWTALPPLPIGARAGDLLAWTGRELVVVGGRTAQDPEGGSRAGAALRPGAGSWRRIADAPLPVPADATAYSVGRYVVVEADSAHWLAYDSTHDSWRRLASPPLYLTVASEGGDRVYALDVIDRIRVLDPVAGTWTTLPADPGLAALRRGAGDDELSVTGYDGGVVVATTKGRADVWDGRRWSVRSQPEPGWVLPGTGAWQRLPAPPDGPTMFPSTYGRDGGPVAVVGRFVWDGDARRWLSPGFPPSREPISFTTERYWAGGRLYQVGGTTLRGPTDEAWVWTAGG